MKIMAIVALATLSGCASIPKAEYVYQGLHAVDALQTVDIKHHPNFRETNPIIGEHPSDGDILVYMAAEAALHLLITQQLEQHNAPKWAKVIWHSISIGWAGRQVIHNYDIGLRP
jgi:hypothetical protein